jgi:molecular chaperone GrpE
MDNSGVPGRKTGTSSQLVYPEVRRIMVYDENEKNDPAGEAETERPSEETDIVEELTKALAAEKERSGANLAGWQRAAADMANYRKRVEQDRSDVMKNANMDLVRRMLPVVDDLGRALQTVPEGLADQPWVEGVRLIERKFLAILEQEGVTPYDALGQVFDPVFHDAVTVEATDPANDGKVIGEIQKGYRFRERVLRPALVRVGKGRAE